MPELYPGQSEVIANHLEQEQLLLEASRERLKAETDPLKRANLLTLIASQAGTVSSRKRALDKSCAETDMTRSTTVSVRFSEQERAELNAKADGGKIGQYIRSMLGYS